VLWTMNGAQIIANQNVGNIDASWHLHGIGDYTGGMPMCSGATTAARPRCGR